MQFDPHFQDEHLQSSMEQRERLLSATERLDRSNNDLKASLVTAQETVTIGIEVMENLDKQKQTMNDIREKVRLSSSFPPHIFSF